MDRRDFLKSVGLAVVSLSASPAMCPGEPTRKLYSPQGHTSMISGGSGKNPNVILIITDDQGYGDLACHGNPVLQTPNLDKLHSESIRLTDFHVSPTCSPTRASLMTGRYCNRTGVWHTIMGRSLLRKDELTMADFFSAGGYRTAIFGKWHLGDNYPFRPQDRGFQEVLIHKAGGVGQGADYWGNDYFDDTYFRNGKPEKFHGYCTDIWFTEAIKVIEANRQRPFFCYLSTNAAHEPYRVPEKHKKLYQEKGPNQTRDSSLAGFYGMITNLDENIGRLRDKLDELDLSNNTILIFTTDNGSAKGDKYFNAQMRGNKGNLYEGGHRVPCFIYWPASDLRPGRDIKQITAHIDLLPTLIELCGLKGKDTVHFDGKSLKPLLNETVSDWPERTIITDSQRVDHPIKSRRYAVMTNKWRLINGKELYNITEEPSQKNDVSDECPHIVRKLQNDYDKWWEDTSARFDEYCRIIIGSDKENPVFLTSHDIHGQVVWNHRQVKNGERADGFWALEVARDGNYEFSVARWPAESKKPIPAETGIQRWRPDKKNNTITHARLKIAGYDKVKAVSPGAGSVKFKVPLKAGKTKLQAWFVNGFGDGAVFGAYYVYVKRVS